MACARCGCIVCQTDDFISLNKIWHKCCFTCYKCETLLDKCSAKVFQGELYCKCCYYEVIDNFGIITCNSNIKPCKVVSSPSCLCDKPLECGDCFKNNFKISIPVNNYTKNTKSCSCLPDKKTNYPNCAKNKNAACVIIPLPREVANYYNRNIVKNKNCCPIKADFYNLSSNPCPKMRLKTLCPKPPPCRSPPSQCLPPDTCCCPKPHPDRCCCPKPQTNKCCCPKSPPKCPTCCPKRPIIPPCCPKVLPTCRCRDSNQCPRDSNQCPRDSNQCNQCQNCCSGEGSRNSNQCPRDSNQCPRDSNQCPRDSNQCNQCQNCCPVQRSKNKCCCQSRGGSGSCCCQQRQHALERNFQEESCSKCCRKMQPTPKYCQCGNQNPCDCKMQKIKEDCTVCCVRCGCKVYAAEKIVVSSGAFHTSCFSCYCCNKSLDVINVYEGCGEIYCKQCYNHFFGTQYYGRSQCC